MYYLYIYLFFYLHFSFYLYLYLYLCLYFYLNFYLYFYRYFYNGLPFTETHCAWLGFITLWMMYGERVALAIIALNATNFLRDNPFFQNSR